MGQRDRYGLVRSERSRRSFERHHVLVLHQHGLHMTGRWVGLSYDGPVITGWGTMARSRDHAVQLMDQLRDSGKVAA